WGVSRIDQIGEPRAVVRIDDQVTAWLEDPCKLLQRVQRRVKPRDDAECESKVECLSFVVQRVNVSLSDVQPPIYAGCVRSLARALEHPRGRIGRFDFEALLCQGHGRQPSAAADLERP